MATDSTVAVKHLFIVYDERAISGDTDDAQVFESDTTESKALKSPFLGYVYRYDIKEPNELVNETFIRPTHLLNKRLQREARG